MSRPREHHAGYVRRLFRAPFPWARAIGVPAVIVVAVFLDAGGLALFVIGSIALVAGAARLIEGAWKIHSHPMRHHRQIGWRKAVSGALTLACVGGAFAAFDASFDRAESSGRRAAAMAQSACAAGAGCPSTLAEAGWIGNHAGWIYRFPLLYVTRESGQSFILWVRAGIDDGTVFVGGKRRPLAECSRLEFEVNRCAEASAGG